MSKHPQNRFRRLVIVGPADKEPRPQSSGPRWWGPQRPKAVRINQESQTTQAQFRSLRMAVMPTFSRGMWFETLAWIWNFVRSYFARPAERKRGAVVLSFRRAAAKDAFVTKKASGSVCWNNDREAAPQEGGRG
jgi:pimeloyl-ACP methyl ester carboxylesterase